MTSGTSFVKSSSFHVDYKNIMIDNRDPLVHYHDAMEIAFFVRSNIHVHISGRSYEFSGGEMMLIHPFETHRIEYKEGEPYERYVVNFSRELIEDFLTRLGYGHLIEQLKDPVGRVRKTDLKQLEQLQSIFELLWMMSQSMIGTEEQHAILKLQMISLLLLFVTLSVKETSSKPLDKEKLVYRIVSYLDQQYREDLSLRDVASHFHLSKFYLGHIFKEITRMTVTDYLHFKRVAEAKRQLKHTDKPVLDVAMDCGFNNVQHFHRVFKKLTNQTPYQYKRLT